MTYLAEIMDTYCWIHSTYSIPSRWNGTKGRHYPHPGVAPPADLAEGSEIKYHKYYQVLTIIAFWGGLIGGGRPERVFLRARYIGQTNCFYNFLPLSSKNENMNDEKMSEKR